MSSRPKTAFAALMLALSCRSATSSHAAPAASERVAELAPSERTAVDARASDNARALEKPRGLPPLEAPAPLVALDVQGYRPAVVSLPLGAREKRPVMVALHGNFDRPDWQCDVWRDVTAAYPFILCPRGVPRGDAPRSWDRWTYNGGAQVEKELLAGLDALKAGFPEYVADGPILYLGFSLGAIVGVGILERHAQRFPRAVLIEGGERWSHAAAKQYAANGGERVLFACGQAACQYASRNTARILERHELSTKVVFGGNIGHTYDGKVADAVASEWAFIVGGLTGWGSSDKHDGGECNQGCLTP